MFPTCSAECEALWQERFAKGLAAYVEACGHREKVEAKPREPARVARCPSCNTRAMSLCMAYGESYLKCERCGYEER
jgi:hypothetical protein